MHDPDTSIDVRRIGRPSERPVWLRPQSWRFETRRLTTPVGELALTDTGSGPTVLLVHVGFWSYVWRDVITELVPGHRCIALDAPGTGLSERVPGTDTSLDAASRAIGAVMDELTEPFVLVVHDLGGVAGLAAAATRGELVRGLIVVNSFAWRPSGIPFRSMLAVVGASPMRELDACTGFLPRVSSTRLGVGRHLTRDDRRVFRAGIDRHARRSFHRYMRSARTSDAVYATVAGALAGPLRDTPVQTVFGERNDPLRFQPQWKRRFPDARQIVVPRGNHFPMCDAPGTVARAIKSVS
jgi:haloalkane dehalogenase